jgi:hypothetical protein
MNVEELIMALVLGIIVLIIAVILWALKIAVSLAVIAGLVGLGMLIYGFVSLIIGRRQSSR